MKMKLSDRKIGEEFYILYGERNFPAKAKLLRWIGVTAELHLPEHECYTKRFKDLWTYCRKSEALKVHIKLLKLEIKHARISIKSAKKLEAGNATDL